MLHIINSINLNYLFNSFKKNITEVWKKPFEPPVVIFSDIKVEHWFKLAWINNSEKSLNDSILMNLNSVRLESFIFEAVARGIKSDSKVWYERLDDSVLKSGIVQKLISEINGIKYYKTLDSKAVEEFIENKDGSINEIHLNNFAGKMAGIFSEYLNTRSKDFNSGIGAKWNSDEFFFNFKNEEDIAIEKWQRKLFKDLLNGDFFSIPAKKDDDYTIKYVPLSELVRININSNDGKVAFKTKSSKIFLFGFSGIGQIYRSILKQLADDSKIELYVYIQASEKDFSTAKNILSKKWNKCGSENISLWKDFKLDSERTFAEEEKFKNKTLLNAIQNQILSDDFNSNDLPENKKDGSITVTSAPSILREIEAVHSSICSIINSKKQNHEPVSYSDFIVLAPDIQKYRVPIVRVFEQNEHFNTNGFPYIPYVMSDYSADSSAVAEAMEIFVSMLFKKSLDRSDLFKIIRNSVVREVKKYSDEEADAWSLWVSELHGFRDRNASPKEWEKVCRRLLLSNLTDNSVKADSDEIYIPYSNIDSENTESLYKFIDAVDSLEKWISYFANKENLVEEDLDKVSDFIEGWLKLPKECSAELNGEHIVYSEIKKAINNQRLMFKFNNEKINAKCFFISLCESAKASKGSSTNLFTGGITFGNFALNRTIPAKYVYLIGLDSKVFPGTDYEQSLDLRLKMPAETGDSSVVLQNKEAFLCQLMAAQNELHISYVNKNLKKDEDFFRSSVIEDLLDYIKNPAEKISDFISSFETSISIDEKRHWDELWTQREFRNKRNFLNLTRQQQSVQASQMDKISTNPERVSISQIKTFLQNPFVFQAKQIFKDSDDETAEEEAMLFEPVKISDLEKTDFIKNAVYNFYESDKSNPLIQVDSEIEKLKIESAIPDGIFGILESSDMKNKIKGIIKNVSYLKSDIKDDFDIQKELPDFKFNESKNISIDQNVNGKNITWMLNGILSGYFWTKQDNKQILEIAEIIPGKDIRPDKYLLNSYITALMLIAEKKDDEPVYVDVHLVNKDKRKGKKIAFTDDAGTFGELNFSYQKQNVTFKVITKKNALKILRDIYEQMFVEKFSVNIPIEIFMKKWDPNSDYHFEKYKYDVEHNYTYQFFSKKDLFNPWTDYGITPDNFETDFTNANEVMAKLIKIFFEE